MKENIAVFISGKGSNARKIQEFFSTDTSICVVLILAEKENPDLEKWCADNNVHFLRIEKGETSNANYLLSICSAYRINWIVLAGFLKKIPEKLIEVYPDKIINIHPALLPKYGGKGMYGDHVHQAVLDANENESGITIHLVNEEYDKGEILAQVKVDLDENETLDSLRSKIQQIEHLHFSSVVRDYIMKNSTRINEKTTF